MDFDRHRTTAVTCCVLAAAMVLALGGCSEPVRPGAGAAPTATTAATTLSPAIDSAGDTASTAAAPSEPSAAPDGAAAAPTGSSTGGARTPGADPSATPMASSTAGAEATTTERGAAKAEAAYSAWLEASNPYRVGKPGTVRAVLVAGKGYKCNDKYPFKFKLDAAPAGLSYPEPTARGIQYGPERSVLPIPIVPQSAGTFTVSGTFSLSVCTESACKIQREPLSVSVRVDP